MRHSLNSAPGHHFYNFYKNIFFLVGKYYVLKSYKIPEFKILLHNISIIFAILEFQHLADTLFMLSIRKINICKIRSRIFLYTFNVQYVYKHHFYVHIFLKTLFPQHWFLELFPIVYQNQITKLQFEEKILKRPFLIQNCLLNRYMKKKYILLFCFYYVSL